MNGISMTRARRRLAALWLIGGGALILVFIIQSLSNYYGDSDESAWSWFLPNIMPTLSLVVGVLVSDSMGRAFRVEMIDRFMYRVAFWLSSVYLAIIALTIFFAGPASADSALAVYETSKLWLGPLQGLVSAALAAFFVMEKAASQEAG